MSLRSLKVDVVSGVKGLSECVIERRVREVIDEPDAERQLALSRRLRAELWDLMSEEDRTRVRSRGLDFALKGQRLRRVK